MLSVTDTGCGMDLQTQKRIFEPFFTTKGPTKGTGLGLATVYGIVKQSLGYTFVYSKLNEGTTFKIFLSPFIEATKREEKVSETKNKLTDHGNKTVLLVEDDDDLREILTHALEGSGFHVLKPVTPEEAISIVKQYSGEIHIVITDVVMPQKSGPEIAKEIRALRPKIQVLFISGYLDDRLEQFGIKSQGNYCLQKPFSSEALISRVERILQSKGSQL
jgi:two-component system cell cycle sensor histidine kinase/response regulator CckA